MKQHHSLTAAALSPHLRTRTGTVGTPGTRLPRALRLALLPLAAGVLLACASAPPTNPAVEEARTLYRQAVTDPEVARSAALELRRAQEALQRADAGLRSGAEVVDVEHEAYLARQSAQVALQAGQIAQAEKAVAQARVDRERILLQARTREAQQQQAAAVQAQAQARAAQTQAQQAIAAAATARTQAETARSAADVARGEAEDARRLAEERLTAESAARAKTAQLQAQLTELQAQPTERGMVLTLGDVLFDTGRAALKPGAASTLDRLAQFMRDQPERTLLVEGHTDSVGADAYNLGLSQQRADAVLAALTQRGVDAKRITTLGVGEARPVAGNDTAAGRQRNRRIEILIQGT